MKEMIYKKDRETEILDEGYYKNYHFLIISYGTHPCAYVEIEKDSKVYGKDYSYSKLENIECHGGLTYSDDLSHVLGEEEAKQRWFIGWDYSHAGDFEGYYEDNEVFKDEKRWTTEEIFEEVKYVIEQLIVIENKKEKPLTSLEALDNLRDKIVYNTGSYQDCLEWLDICKEELEKSIKREEALQEIFDNAEYVMVKYPAFILDVNTSISKETAEFLKEYIHE